MTRARPTSKLSFAADASTSTFAGGNVRPSMFLVAARIPLARRAVRAVQWALWNSSWQGIEPKTETLSRLLWHKGADHRPPRLPISIASWRLVNFRRASMPVPSGLAKLGPAPSGARNSPGQRLEPCRRASSRPSFPKRGSPARAQALPSQLSAACPIRGSDRAAAAWGPAPCRSR